MVGSTTSSSLLWPPCAEDADIIFCSSGFCLLFFSSPILSGQRVDVYHTSTRCGLSTNLECISGMCCMRFAGNTGRKNDAKNAHHYTTLSNYVFATKACNLFNSNIFSRCPHNMASFGPLTAERGWRVWGTPANFNGFRVLASLLQ